MTQDYYATLGVTPTADAAAVRAAYLALMREYHPDRNSSPAAVERAQAIIAAFKVLGDFDRRSHYDWDRRRAREAAAALAAKRPRKIGAGAVAGAIGLAAAGALFFLPTRPVDSPVAAVREVPVAKAKPVAQPRRVAVARPFEKRVEKRAPVPKAEPRTQPVRVAKAAPVPPKPAKAIRAPVVVRVAAVKAPVPRVVAVEAAARPARQTAKSATDLASLDQFVMAFYGQSWRYGDAPKRAALVQSRDDFVARRGACGADACKRAAYLKLMRDVSEIVETGQPKAR